MGRGLRPSWNVSKPLSPPAVPNGGAPEMERTITCTLTIWLVGFSIGAVATRSVVSGGDPPVDSAGGIAGDGNEGSGVAARGLSVRPLLCVLGGEAVAGDGLASGERLCREERSGREPSLACLACMPSRRRGFVGPRESAVTTEDSSVRAWSGSVDPGRLSRLDGGAILTGTAVKNTGHFVATNDVARKTLAAREPVTTTLRTRWWRLPTRSGVGRCSRLFRPMQPEQSGSTASKGAEQGLMCRQLIPHAGQQWKCDPVRAPGAGLTSFGKHQGHPRGNPSGHRPS